MSNLYLTEESMPARVSIMDHHCAASDDLKVKRLAFVLSGLLLLVFVFGGCTMVGPDYIKPSATARMAAIRGFQNKKQGG